MTRQAENQQTVEALAAQIRPAFVRNPDRAKLEAALRDLVAQAELAQERGGYFVTRTEWEEFRRWQLAGATCEICGNPGDAAYRGYHDEGSPMKTCSECEPARLDGART